jgi:hypothetical protein
MASLPAPKDQQGISREIGRSAVLRKAGDDGSVREAVPVSELAVTRTENRATPKPVFRPPE